MLPFPLLSENPFRLLGLGSAASQAELRFAANAADKAVKVGILPDSGLTAVFGQESLAACVDAVRTLAGDPQHRTQYRLFWPFHYQANPTFDGSLGDLNRFSPAPDAPRFHASQAHFLFCWIDFLVRPTPAKAAEALDAFCILYTDDSLDAFLVDLLIGEGVEKGEAWNLIYAAVEAVAVLLLETVSREAVSRWAAGDIAATISLISAVAESGYHDDFIDKALVALTGPGDREAERLKKSIHEFSGWSSDTPHYDLSEVERLRLPAQALDGHLPAAPLWLEIAERRVHQVAVAMRNCAIDLANDKDDYDAASRILAQAQSLPLPEDIAQQIRDDREGLRKLVSDKQTWAGITPIKSAPSLTSVNGMGFSLYGKTPFPAKPGWYFANHYFVFLCLPVCPLGRYLVSDAPNGGWYFHARAPLRRFDRYHLGTGVALVCLFVGWLFASGNRGGSSGGYNSSSDYTSTYPRVAAPVTSHDEEEYDRLKIELDASRNDLAVRKITLEGVAKKLESDGNTLDPSDGAAVYAYNVRVRKFNTDKDRLNANVKTYNAKVKRLNELANRLGEK